MSAAPDDLDLDEAPECEHTWELESDEQGDAREAQLYGDYSVMVCADCGAEREVEEDDLAKVREEAQVDRYLARLYR